MSPPYPGHISKPNRWKHKALVLEQLGENKLARESDLRAKQIDMSLNSYLTLDTYI
jgi:hypothetical protein